MGRIIFGLHKTIKIQLNITQSFQKTILKGYYSQPLFFWIDVSVFVTILHGLDYYNLKKVDSKTSEISKMFGLFNV